MFVCVSVAGRTYLKVLLSSVLVLKRYFPLYNSTITTVQVRSTSYMPHPHQEEAAQDMAEAVREAASALSIAASTLI